MHVMLRSDRTGKLPVRSVYIVPAVVSVSAAKQKTAWDASSIGGCNCGLSSVGWLGLVDEIPCRTLRIWPLSVAMTRRRCVVMSCLVSPGIVMSSVLRSSACNSVDAGGDPNA